MQKIDYSRNCKACKHFKASSANWDGYCMREVEYDCSVINGKLLVWGAEVCSKMRDKVLGKCGREGKFFEKATLLDKLKRFFRKQNWPVGLDYSCWEIETRQIDYQFWKQHGYYRTKD